MGEAGRGGGRFARAGLGPRSLGTVAAYAAATVAFAYALVSLYWAEGGHGLIRTVGGYAEQLSRDARAVAVLVGVSVPGAKPACLRSR
jgi:hypothetical protein